MTRLYSPQTSALTGLRYAPTAEKHRFPSCFALGAQGAEIAKSARNGNVRDFLERKVPKRIPNSTRLL